LSLRTGVLAAGVLSAVLDAWTLEDGVQPPETVAERLVGWPDGAQNVLEIADAALADQLAAWIDRLRARCQEVV
jgi:hypothetical protein